MDIYDVLEYNITLKIKRIYKKWIKPYRFNLYFTNDFPNIKNTILKKYNIYMPFHISCKLCDLLLFIEIHKKYIPLRRKKLEDILPSSKVTNIILTHDGYIAAQSFIWNENKIASERFEEIT